MAAFHLGKSVDVESSCFFIKVYRHIEGEQKMSAVNTEPGGKVP